MIGTGVTENSAFSKLVRESYIHFFVAAYYTEVRSINVYATYFKLLSGLTKQM